MFSVLTVLSDAVCLVVLKLWLLYRGKEGGFNLAVNASVSVDR